LKTEIKKLRKRIYKNLKNKAQALEGKKSRELLTYEKDQIIFSKRDFDSSSIDELIQQVISSQVIYLGDFHTFDQNMRNVLRILKVLQQSKQKCIIALEMVDAKYQFYVDSFVEHHITELEFLESIKYHDSWRFPWIHYNVIFEIAKKENIKVLALNTSGTLTERDEFAADIISNVLNRDEDVQVLVVYGELHISPDKLPQKVKDLTENVNQTIVHQNLDEVYWKLIELEQSDKIIRFNQEEFCINSAPPWIKYESMIYWYENMSDDPEFDIHEYIIENGKKIFGDDAYDNFLLLSEEMIDALKLKISRSDLEDFNLFDHTNLEYIQEEVDKLPLKKHKDFYQQLISKGFSFNLPGRSIFYCSSYSMNRLAYLAGIHIYHVYLDQVEIDTAQIIYGKDNFKLFTLFTYEAMYAYFFSKVINPHRKCNMYQDFKDQLACEADESLRLELKHTLDILDQKNDQEILNSLKTFEVYRLALNIGHLFGEYLYTAIYNLSFKIKIEKEFIKNPIDENSFHEIRNTLIGSRDYQQDRKRYF
tara:strand:+ start:133499 stop:135103 length:1605 start_codon:yes stop_codon:yes gene_type:complete